MHYSIKYILFFLKVIAIENRKPKFIKLYHIILFCVQNLKITVISNIFFTTYFSLNMPFCCGYFRKTVASFATAIPEKEMFRLQVQRYFASLLISLAVPSITVKFLK